MSDWVSLSFVIPEALPIVPNQKCEYEGVVDVRQKDKPIRQTTNPRAGVNTTMALFN